MNDLDERCGALVAEWGVPAKLVRSGMARDCIAATLDYKPGPQGLALVDAKQVLIAAPLEIEPDHELDKFYLNGKLYDIALPVKGPRPNDIPVYFDLLVQYSQEASY